MKTEFGLEIFVRPKTHPPWRTSGFGTSVFLFSSIESSFDACRSVVLYPRPPRMKTTAEQSRGEGVVWCVDGRDVLNRLVGNEGPDFTRFYENVVL